MPRRNTYHIVHADDAWLVRLEGSPTPSASEPTRGEAIEAAGEILRLLGDGRVVVHDADGRIERAYSLATLPSLDAVRERSRRWAVAAGVLGVAFVVGLAAAIARRDERA